MHSSRLVSLGAWRTGAAAPLPWYRRQSPTLSWFDLHDPIEAGGHDLVASIVDIVNIASGAGLAEARQLPQAAHAAAKGAMLALTRQLAAEGMAVGVRVNAVSPGVMGTPPIIAMYEEMGADAPVASIVERTITGAPGDPMCVAYAGLYLASDEAAWVTGTNLVVDGGASAVMEPNSG